MRQCRSMARISLSQLRDAEQRMRIDPATSDHKVYPEFLRFFRQCDCIDEHMFIVGTNMAYGWMPTAVDLYGQDFSKAISLLNEVRTGKRLSRAELEDIRSIVNRSVVGTSKVLHFVNPKSYPIWDSKVCAFIDSIRDARHRKAKKDEVLDFLCYINNCDELVQQDGFRAIHQSVNAKVGYEVSPYRAVELILYEGGKTVPRTKNGV